jgi:hypothetical protein
VKNKEIEITRIDNPNHVKEYGKIDDISNGVKNKEIENGDKKQQAPLNDILGLSWLLTIHDNDSEKMLTYEQIESKLRAKYIVAYFCISTEMSDNGSLHYHIFIYLKKRFASFMELKKLFPTAHIDKCKADNPYDVVAYVKKAVSGKHLIKSILKLTVMGVSMNQGI